ncbi:MAG: sensor histidine kinase [Chitinophaga sp.]|uniref:tetratricopeptide repeat-containing sensor histidine kinase n=1 Tax=Chitinophaga sp. TaxID=1869181 RepID=UPI001B1F6448|nr:sensor histidine kinase [Chitinophaga sp.]MBO9732718.1 sensor histidine kinase [Chitinophaga sp.]
MRKLLFFLFLLTANPWCLAQVHLSGPSPADSLEKILIQPGPDSLRARASFALSDYWTAKDTLKAMKFLREGAPYIKKHPYLQALYYFYEGRLLNKSNPDKSQQNYMLTDSLLQHIKTQESYFFRAQAWYEYGRIQQRKDDYKAFADIILNRSIPLAEQSGNQVLVGKNYLALAIVFKNASQFDKAETYCLKTIDILKPLTPPAKELIDAYHTIAENYSLSGQNVKAKAALDSMYPLLKAYPDSEYYLDYYAAEGMYFTIEGKFNDALASLDKGVALAQKLGLKYEEQRLLLQKFYAYYNAKNFVSAKDVLTYLMKQEQMMSLSSNRLQLYYGMAVTYEGLKQWAPAFEWMKRYSEFSDSVAQSQLKNDVHALEIKFRDAEKEKEITALKAQRMEQSLAASNGRLVNWLLGCASLFLLIILVFALILYRSKKKLMIQKELSYQQHLHEIEQQQQLQFSQAVLQGEEQERRRLARDLHDGLGGMLAGAKINLSAQIEDTFSPNQRQELTKITAQLDHSVTELRRIAHNMMPVNLLKFGLTTALKDLCESLMTDSTQIDFQALGIQDSLKEEVQLHIYRIVQELLSNAIRHAAASHIILQCSQDEDLFFITQEDNGKGFDPTVNGPASGIGLSNIKNRVGFLKGKIDIDSAPDQGTTINIELHVN